MQSVSGVYSARVVDVDDPLELCRVRALIPQISGAQPSGWIVPAVVCQPNVGDHIYVGFDGNDPSVPVYWQATDQPWKNCVPRTDVLPWTAQSFRGPQARISNDGDYAQFTGQLVINFANYPISISNLVEYPLFDYPARLRQPPDYTLGLAAVDTFVTSDPQLKLTSGATTPAGPSGGTQINLFHARVRYDSGAGNNGTVWVWFPTPLAGCNYLMVDISMWQIPLVVF